MTRRGLCAGCSCLAAALVAIAQGGELALAGEAKPMPVAVYHFDGDGGEWVLDASDAENHGVLGLLSKPDRRDPKRVAGGKRGAALEFDGKDDVVTIEATASLVPVAGLEIEAWVFQTRRSPYARVFDKRPCFDMYIHENGVLAFRFRGAEAHGVRSPEPVPLNQWVHVKGTYDGRTMALCVDGKRVASRPYAGPMPNRPPESAGALRIGNSSMARPFCGLIDEVKIVNIGYAPPLANPFESDADTAALWHLDQADRAVDAGPHGLHGRVQAAQRQPGKIGHALGFDGKAHVQAPHHAALDLQHELTIDCWVKHLRRTPYARIVEKDDWVYGLWITQAGHVDFYYKTPAGSTNHTLTDAELPLNRWVHIRGEFDGMETIVYFDGREVSRKTVPDGKQVIAVSKGDVFIGNRRLGDRGFVGLIDEVRLSSSVRRARPPLLVKVSTYPSTQRWSIRVNARGARAPVTAVSGAVRRQADGQAVLPVDVPNLRRSCGTVDCDASGLPPGRYVVALSAFRGDGANVGEAEVEVIKPDKPAWLGAGTGISDAVLPPWSAMTVQTAAGGEVQLGCWGRTHHFRGSPFPAQITSAGEDLLAGPVRIVVNGEDPTMGRVRVDRSAPHEVRLIGTATAGPCEITATVTAEYDGMMRFDVQLTPKRDGAVESAWLEIPLARPRATLIHHPGRWFEDPTCASALPKDGWRAPHTWYLWLGDEARGLCWFAEDQSIWGLDPNRPGIEAIPDRDVVRLRVWLASAGPIREPVQRTWGLMATPVKPRPQGWQRWRFGNPRGPVNIGVRWSTTRSSKWHSFPVPPDPKAYRGDIAQVHAAGMKFVPYTNFNMQSDTGPEWDYWGQDWHGHAGLGTAADVLAMNVVNVRCCAMTPSWCDSIVWKYKQFLDEYDSDGFYLDNSSPGKCNNPLHPKSHHERRHIFAARSLMKRFYTVTKQHDPANVMVCHMSTRLCIPVLSFCDAIVDGEQYGWALDENFDGHYIPLTPIDRVRAELMLHQWGLVPFFLPCNRGPNPWSPELMRELLALMLPHGMRFWIGGERITMAKVLDVVDAFDLPRARFVPYWSVPRWRARAEQEGLLVSAYVRDGRVMVLVSNLRDQLRQASVGLPAADLGLERLPGRSTDPLDGLPVTLREGSLQLALAARNLRIILVEP